MTRLNYLSALLLILLTIGSSQAVAIRANWKKVSNRVYGVIRTEFGDGSKMVNMDVVPSDLAKHVGEIELANLAGWAVVLNACPPCSWIALVSVDVDRLDCSFVVCSVFRDLIW